MPEFIAHIPRHTRSHLDDFIKGYLTAAEWLLPEDIDRNEIHGWSNIALREARRDCANFQALNGKDLIRYYAAVGLSNGCTPQELAGRDFFLTRNRRNVGFRDRGLNEAGERLAASAHAFVETEVYMYKGRLYF